MCDIDYNKYSPLHCHGPYSKDGYGPWSMMVERAKELDMSHIALTDHGTAAGFVEHYEETKARGIKPIYGIEGYISLDPDADKIQINHITVLAQTKQGYENLIALNNASHRQMVKKRSLKFPLMTFKNFKEYREGLIVLTGCPASLIYHEDFEVAYGYVESLINIFGEENVFAELMFVLDGQDHHSRPLEIAAELGIRPVITNDTHFTYPDDAQGHMICTGIRAKALAGTEYSYDNEVLYLMSGKEVADRASRYLDAYTVSECFNNIELITQNVEEIDLRHDVVVPEVTDEEIKKFKSLLYKKLEEYIEHNPHYEEKARKRFAAEWKVIDDFDFWTYFYIVNDIVYYVRKHNRLSTARGSAGGSFIIYLLDIVSVDPIRYNLLFERFLNTERKDYPDVDIDVDSTFRPQLVEYCQQRWGLESVNTTITFGHKSLVRDIGQKYRLPYETQIRAAAVDAGSDEFAQICDEYPEFARAYELMIDQPKTVGTHAAAMASINNELPLPVENWGNSPGIAFSESGSNKSLSIVGGLKFDILGLRALAGLYKLYETTKVQPPVDIDSDFPAEIFATGKTLGIFQFDGSEGIKEMCKDIKPQNLEELAIINSMYRPGALDAGTAQHYMEYKKNPRHFNDEIDEVLQRTASVIVFQEQVMQLYAIVTGEGLEGADLARRILSPKSPKVLQDPKWQKSVKEVEKNFFDKGIENGYSKTMLEQLWAELYAHSRYSFNKSHSIAYGYLAAQQAWYKLNYPTEFYFAALNTLLEENKNLMMQDYIWELALEGFNILPPNVKYSSTSFELSYNKDADITYSVDDETNNGKLYLPLTLVKFVSDRSLEALEYLKAYIQGTGEEWLAERINVSLGEPAEAFVDSALDETAFDAVNALDYYKTVRERLDKLQPTEITCEAIATLSKGHVWNKRAKENMYAVGGFDDIPGDISKLLDIDTINQNNPTANQIESMDVTIPTKQHLLRHAHAQKNGYRFGIITKIIKKTTQKGTPIVIYLLTGKQTIRIFQKDLDLFPDLKVGVPVAAFTNQYGYIDFKDRERTVPRYKIYV